MARTVTAREAEENVADLLASAEAGEETLILKHGQPVAKLVPATADDYVPTLEERMAAFDRLTRRIEERKKAAEELLSHAQANPGSPEPGWRFSRDEIYDDRFDRR